MAKDKEMSQVNIMIFACVIVSALPYFCWWHQTAVNARNFWFCLVDIVLTVSLYFAGRKCVRQVKENETETNGTRLLTILIAVAQFIWVASWAAYQNELIK